MKMQINKKLIVVTRQDLTPGYQAVQSIHALPEFAKEHPETYQHWYNTSKYIALLSVKDEHHIKNLIRKLNEKGIKYSIFLEPDIDNQVTSVSIEPSEEAHHVCKRLPLALKEYDNRNLINKHNFQYSRKEIAIMREKFERELQEMYKE